MLNMVSFFNTEEHTVIGGDITAFCERLVEGDLQRRGKLCIIKYNKLDTYVIAEWLAKPKDIFVDVLNLGDSLSNFTQKKAQELRKRLFAPLTAEGTAEQLIVHESDYMHQCQDDSEEESERLAKCAIGE